MNFEHVLAHHLIDEKLFHLTIAHVSLGSTVIPVDLGLSPLILSMWGAALLLTAFLTFAARSRSEAGRVARGMVEPVLLYLRDENIVPIFGGHSEQFTPFFLTVFFFILACNLFGLVPFTEGTTSNIAVTAAMATCTLVMIVAVGIREQGFLGYFKHLVPSGVPWWLYWLLFLIELLVLVAKCFALCIRLFANMLAGHIASLTFIFLIFILSQTSHSLGAGSAPAAVGLALFSYLLDVLIAFLQAYIFMILSAVFVGMSVHPH
ncbi:MAG: F0F1 ATP synthase subunit A [Elusimicrobia bacterium]|nr:F0F1 ATP synthase subunit A [Elusimicrobiota bacterium]